MTNQNKPSWIVTSAKASPLRQMFLALLILIELLYIGGSYLAGDDLIASSQLIEVAVAIVAIIFAYATWQRQNYERKAALINSILQEVRHNLSLVEGTIATSPTDADLYCIKLFSDSMGPWDAYPAADGNVKDKLMIDAPVNLISSSTTKLVTPLFEGAIGAAIWSGNAALFLTERVFLNLGHVQFSIQRYNRSVERFNAGASDFHILKHEYQEWVHFRLHLLLLDLVRVENADYIIDKSFAKEIHDRLESGALQISDKFRMQGTQSSHPNSVPKDRLPFGYKEKKEETIKSGSESGK